MFNILKEKDPEIYKAIFNEQKRQKEGLELIASENYVSHAVLAAMGSVLTNKYSEGYPGKRYYGGNRFIDQAENLAIRRAKKLFGAEHVNVQPYSGSPANIEVYFAFVPFGGKIMGMSLAHGGHLTHGHKVNFSGKAYQVVSYGVEKNGHIAYAKVRALAKAEKPNLIISGYTAYPRKVDFKKFKEIADEVGAISMADISHIAGLIAAGLHENPVPYFDVVTTTTHKTLRGPRGAMIMCKRKWAEIVDRAVFPGMQGGPHNHINAAKAVAFGEASKPEFKIYCRQIIKNAKALAAALMKLRFTVVSGGTDNHLMLVDLTNKEVTGKEAEHILEEAGITLNKNMVPYDPRSPFDPSGVRIGTPAVTSRGMKEPEMQKIALWIDRAIRAKNRAAELLKIKREIKEFCEDFPVPGIDVN
ncbi:MAG: glycine hydroxymethyltransferase [Parcubacteria group bacterium LiPW_72]|nr:MAG: glycine hydroxymethyltransferase [Parcubacteria group bacterium LiPW_72]